MARMRRLWVPALVGVLVTVLLGPAGVTAVEPRTVTASIMIPATAFIPNSDSVDYFSSGLDLITPTGIGNFTAPLSFPVPVVSIKKITLYAFDNDTSGFVATALGRSRPADGAVAEAVLLRSVDSPADPQAIYTTTISPRQINTAFHGPSLLVTLGGPNVKFYGVKVTYSYDPGA